MGSFENTDFLRGIKIHTSSVGRSNKPQLKNTTKQEPMLTNQTQASDNSNFSEQIQRRKPQWFHALLQKAQQNGGYKSGQV